MFNRDGWILGVSAKYLDWRATLSRFARTLTSFLSPNISCISHQLIYKTLWSRNFSPLPSSQVLWTTYGGSISSLCRYFNFPQSSWTLTQSVGNSSHNISQGTRDFVMSALQYYIESPGSYIRMLKHLGTPPDLHLRGSSWEQLTTKSQYFVRWHEAHTLHMVSG